MHKRDQEEGAMALPKFFRPDHSNKLYLSEVTTKRLSADWITNQS